MYFLKFKTEHTILNILRLAIFQIFFEDKQPYACVESAVNLTKFKLNKKHKAPGYVNAILRSVLRNQNAAVYMRRRNNIVFYKTELSQHFLQIYGKREQKKTLNMRIYAMCALYHCSKEEKKISMYRNIVEYSSWKSLNG